MELELSLGVSPALAKGAVMPLLASTRAGEGEGHELVLELGGRTAKEAELDNPKAHVQPEDVQEEDDESHAHSELLVDLNQGCPLPTNSAERGSVNFDVYMPGYVVNTVTMDGDMSQLEIPGRHTGKDNGGVSGGARKKQRLTKMQFAFMEDSFKEHSTLTPRQTGDLANRLNLRPRQVAVWFQNRRARTKLKQTKVDCDNLKHSCEKLTQENQRLQDEVAELRAFVHTTTCVIYSHLPAGFGAARRAAAEPPPPGLRGAP
ncbi:unnamed protein product [Urochloa decumbens]|uniref:Homeobox domain-containing protein n=1 Tax=Urochloa decumbens TaxID=240449 RepID=A0ABC8VYM2_9POAL